MIVLDMKRKARCAMFHFVFLVIFHKYCFYAAHAASAQDVTPFAQGVRGNYAFYLLQSPGNIHQPFFIRGQTLNV